MPEPLWELLFFIKKKNIKVTFSRESFILKLDTTNIKSFINLIKKIYPEYLNDNLETKWLSTNFMMLEISSIINQFGDVDTFIKNYKGGTI